LELLFRTGLVGLLLAHRWRSGVVLLLSATELNLLNLLLDVGVVGLVVESVEVIYVHLW
jgi:hypothetical protein